MSCPAVKPLPCWIPPLLLLLCAVPYHPVLAQDSVSSSPAQTRHSVQGVVVNSSTGEPVRRAIVQVFAGSTRQTLTDNEGRFHFYGLPATHASIVARKPGFFNPQQVNAGIQPADSVDIGNDTPEVQVKLVPESVLFGRVTDVSGEPVENIPVRVISSRVSDGKRHWEQRGAALSDDDGQFRVSGLMPGSYFVVVGPSWERAFASFSERPPTRKSTDSGYSERFYPDVNDIQSASPIELLAGQQVETDFSVKPEPLFDVAGSITGVGPGQNVNLQFISRSGESANFPVRYHNNNGTFETKAPAGVYTLRAHAQGLGGTMVGDAPIVVTSNTAGVRIALSPAASIPVSVSFRSSHSSLTNRDDLNLQPVTVQLMAQGLSILTQNGYFSFVKGSGKNASVVVADVDPGNYAVGITPNGDWWVESARYGGSLDLLQENLPVVAGVRPLPIEIVLRDDGASLTGTVTQSGRKTQAGVFLVPERGPAGNSRTTFASSTGRFHFSNLAPGDYLVLALDQSPETMEYGNPEALEPYLSEASHVTLQAGETSTINVELARLHP